MGLRLPYKAIWLLSGRALGGMGLRPESWNPGLQKVGTASVTGQILNESLRETQGKGPVARSTQARESQEPSQGGDA